MRAQIVELFILIQIRFHERITLPVQGIENDERSGRNMDLLCELTHGAASNILQIEPGLGCEIVFLCKLLNAFVTVRLTDRPASAPGMLGKQQDIVPYIVKLRLGRPEAWIDDMSNR